jgi:hypothetical protein
MDALKLISTPNTINDEVIFHLVHLKIAYVGKDSKRYDQIAHHMSKIVGPHHLKQVNIEDCHSLLSHGRLQQGDNANINSIIFDIFSYSPEEATQFISKVRSEHPNISFSLIGRIQQFQEFQDYSDTWKIRFTHYYKIHDNHDSDKLFKDFKTTFYLFAADQLKCKFMNDNGVISTQKAYKTLAKLPFTKFLNVYKSYLGAITLTLGTIYTILTKSAAILDFFKSI